MKMDQSLTYQEKENIIVYIAREYRRCKRRMDYYEFENRIKENQQTYHSDRSLVFLVDRTLKDCTKTTQCIIENDFLHPYDEKWHTALFSRNTYYRARKNAIDEFLEHLDI